MHFDVHAQVSKCLTNAFCCPWEHIRIVRVSVCIQYVSTHAMPYLMSSSPWLSLLSAGLGFAFC